MAVDVVSAGMGRSSLVSPRPSGWRIFGASASARRCASAAASPRAVVDARWTHRRALTTASGCAENCFSRHAGAHLRRVRSRRRNSPASPSDDVHLCLLLNAAAPRPAAQRLRVRRPPRRPPPTPRPHRSRVAGRRRRSERAEARVDERARRRRSSRASTRSPAPTPTCVAPSPHDRPRARARGAGLAPTSSRCARARRATQEGDRRRCATRRGSVEWLRAAAAGCR